MKKENNKNIILIVFIVIAIIIGITMGIIMAKVRKENNKDNKNITTISYETEMQSVIIAEVEESKEKSKKVDFLANVTAPMYKKSEKDIKIPIIIYHAFATPAPAQDIYKLYSTGPRFEENVFTMLNDGYTFISFEELYKYNKNELALPEKVCIITMDDGNIGCYTDAFPVLKRYNVPATIFIINDCVGTSNYFSWKQAKEMYDTGLVKLNIHGKSHIDYSNVSKEKLLSDYLTGHAELEEKIGETILKVMAYPSGKCSENTKKWLEESGFEIQVLTKYGTVNKSRTLNLTNLGRIRGEQATGSQLLKIIKNASV